MKTIYHSIITQIGANANEALADGMLITFKEGAPPDLVDYCFIHSHGELNGELQPGIVLELAGQNYPVTAVGEVAQDNFRSLGHITLRFDGATKAEYPGCIHINGTAPTQIPPGAAIRFLA